MIKWVGIIRVYKIAKCFMKNLFTFSSLDPQSSSEDQYNPEESMKNPSERRQYNPSWDNYQPFPNWDSQSGIKHVKGRKH